ncbi:MAG TPA: HAMP domain-containing sensor histidine kinase [Kofleriaceae bacterium]|jgi:signal transduction histidine kinase
MEKARGDGLQERSGSLVEQVGPYVCLPTNAEPAGALGNELAQIVHDLKNPLSSIALETEVLDARGVSCQGVDARQAMARIRRNVRFLDRLIYDLVDVCTLSDGRFALRRTRCDVAALLSIVIERVVPAGDRHRVRLDAPLGIDAMIDELRIERVAANLLDNALKYTPADAPIVVTARREGDAVAISVADTGPGLTASEVAHLFEPYRRGGTSRGRTGTGLGLFVSKQIVEAHGGRIGVDSVTGVGARFFFALPLL